MSAHLEKRTRKRLAELEAAGLRRRLVPPSGIDLSSNDYLGLAEHPLLKQRMAEAVRQEGCGSTASRLLRGERASFSALERRFADFKGTQAALYFSSGYQANLGVLATFLEPGDVVFSDELNHASLIDGIRLGRARREIFPHRDVGALRRLLASESQKGQLYIVTESLFSMDGDFAPLSGYADLCRETGAVLIVDEAHAVGIYGEAGSGLIEQTGCADDVFLSINPAGKALGVSGAFVCGPSWAIDYLIQKARTLIFSTAAPPAIAAALDAALDIVAAEPERRAKLRQRANELRRRLHDGGLPVDEEGSQIIPVVIGDNGFAVELAEYFTAQGFDVRAIRPPTVPAGTARLRISVNVKSSDADLQRFSDQLCAACAKISPSIAASS